MPAGGSSAYPFPGLRLAFRRPWSPVTTAKVCDQRLEGCPVDELRAALEREAILLREKDILVQEQEVLRTESEHRLLNGLQMVVSLLSLQGWRAATPEVAAQLSAAANRVAMIERMHRRLHFHDGTNTVRLKQYLQELCQDYAGLADTGEAPRLEILFEGGEIEVPSRTAISLGFIVCELITNAIKHGKGRVIVGLDTDPEKGYALSVCNDGPALPDGFDPAGCKGLGMKVVRSLTRKIGGEFGFGRGTGNQGARFVVLFS